MDRPISSMMAKTLVCVSSEDSLEAVESILARRRVSAVPVLDCDGRLFGILTATDIMRLHCERKNFRAVRAWEACTYKPLEVSPDTPAREVAALMVKHRMHHVLVTENGELRGLVSAYDFVEQRLDENLPAALARIKTGG